MPAVSAIIEELIDGAGYIRLPNLMSAAEAAEVMKGPGRSTFAGCSGTVRSSSAWRSIRQLSKSPRRCSATI
jgi:hypothetical protein